LPRRGGGRGGAGGTGGAGRGGERRRASDRLHRQVAAQGGHEGGDIGKTILHVDRHRPLQRGVDMRRHFGVEAAGRLQVLLVEHPLDAVGRRLVRQ
jgi:hypothetical protein